MQENPLDSLVTDSRDHNQDLAPAYVLAPRFEVPLPVSSVAVDPERAEWWIMDEPDADLQAVRRELVQAVHPISFEEFSSRLRGVAAAVTETLAASKQPYALLYDGKPHSSKRWASELVRDELSQYPPADGFYLSKLEIPLGMPTIVSALDHGIENFVVFDDAIYSGEQVTNTIIRPIFELMASPDFQQKYADRKISITLAAPYISNRFLNRPFVKQLQQQGFLRIADGYEVMPTVDAILTDDAKATIRHFGDKVSSDPSQDVFYMPPAYIFDHRIPDSHSFPEELHGIFAAYPAKPYDQPDSSYYAIEAKEFQAYWGPLIQKKLLQDKANAQSS